jgi:hypothetical protein
MSNPLEVFAVIGLTAAGTWILTIAVPALLHQPVQRRPVHTPIPPPEPPPPTPPPMPTWHATGTDRHDELAMLDRLHARAVAAGNTRVQLAIEHIRARDYQPRSTDDTGPIVVTPPGGWGPWIPPGYQPPPHAT